MINKRNHTLTTVRHVSQCCSLRYSFSFSHKMSRPSWFEFTIIAILGLMRKRASPCIQKCLCITAMVNRWSLKLYVNKCKTAFYGRAINLNTKLQILSIINRVGKSWFHERFRCGIWFRIKFCFSSPANSAIEATDAPENTCWKSDNARS